MSDASDLPAFPPEPPPNLKITSRLYFAELGGFIGCLAGGFILMGVGLENPWILSLLVAPLGLFGGWLGFKFGELNPDPTYAERRRELLVPFEVQTTQACESCGSIPAFETTQWAALLMDKQIVGRQGTSSLFEYSETVISGEICVCPGCVEENYDRILGPKWIWYVFLGFVGVFFALCPFVLMFEDVGMGLFLLVFLYGSLGPLVAGYWHAKHKGIPPSAADVLAQWGRRNQAKQACERKAVESLIAPYASWVEAKFSHTELRIEFGRAARALLHKTYTQEDGHTGYAPVGDYEELDAKQLTVGSSEWRALHTNPDGIPRVLAVSESCSQVLITPRLIQLSPTTASASCRVQFTTAEPLKMTRARCSSRWSTIRLNGDSVEVKVAHNPSSSKQAIARIAVEGGFLQEIQIPILFRGDETMEQRAESQSD